MFGRSGFLLMLVLTVVMNSGCGSESQLNRKAVSGQVNIDGAPLPNGVIRLVPQTTTGGPGVMAEIVAGKFGLDEELGPVPGLHRVEIEATQHLSFEIDNEVAYAAAVVETGRSPLARNPVPAIYNRESTLTANVADTQNQFFQFDLKSKP
jgi:hypothetical protein